MQHHVTEIFVHVAPSVLTNGDLARMQEMKALADVSRIKLRALGGDPAWVTDHAAALAWQQTVVSTGLFAGIHLDVEPYLTEGWTTDLQATETAFLQLLSKLRAGSTLPLEADVPFWYGEYQVGTRNLADEVLRRVNAVTVMSYRDTATGPNSIMAISQDWLDRGKARASAYASAWRPGRWPTAATARSMRRARPASLRNWPTWTRQTRQSAAFAGIAVHHYGSLARTCPI